MLVIDDSELEALYKALQDIDGGRALPFAAGRSLTKIAQNARAQWEVEGRKSLTVRNQYTFNKRNHRYIKARVMKNVNMMESRVGNKLRYVDMQETGFTKFRAKGLQIPLTSARVGSSNERIVRRAYWRERIGASLGRRYKFSKFKNQKNSYRRYIAATVRAAKARGRRYVYLNFSSRNRALYDIGAKKGSKKLEKVWQMNQRTTRTGRTPILKRTLEKLQGSSKAIHRESLDFQLRKVLQKRGIRVRGPSGLSAYRELRAR